jgi:hypothetical protein
MSGFSYPQPIFISDTYNPSFYLSLDQTGYLTYAYAQTLYLDRNDYRLSYLTGISDGTASPNLALVPASDGSITGLGALSCSSLTVDGSAVVAPPSYVVGITAGQAANNKALVLDGSGSIATITSLTATYIYGSIKTGAQTNITSLGTLSSLAIATSNTTTNASLMSDYSLSLTNPNSVNGNKVGVVFGISANLLSACTGGASIVHQRSDIQSIGSLRFNIRISQGPLDSLVEAFRVNADASTTFNYLMTIDSNLTFSGASRTITGLSSISATTLTGTLSTATQTAITSVGALSGLTIDGNLTFTGASRTITGLNSISATDINATTYKQSGTTYDLSLVNRLALTTLGSAEASKALVLDLTSSARGVVSLEINQTAILSTSSSMDAFGLILRRNSATLGDTSGIAFGVTNVSSISTTTGGASIIFTRTGAHSIVECSNIIGYSYDPSKRSFEI